MSPAEPDRWRAETSATPDSTDRTRGPAPPPDTAASSDPAGGDAAASLLAAARRLFARGGYDGTSVREITDAADVNLGAVTYHFGSKRALYEAVVGECAAPLVRGAREAARREKEGRADARRRILAAVEAMIRHLEREPDLPALLLQEVGVGREPPPAVAGPLEELVGLLADLVRRGKSDGTVDAGDPLLTASTLVSEVLASPLVRRAVGGRRGRGEGQLGRSAAGVRAHVREVTERTLGGG